MGLATSTVRDYLLRCGAWMGDLPLADTMRSGLVRVEGPPALVRAFPGWLALSGFAFVERPRAGAAR